MRALVRPASEDVVHIAEVIIIGNQTQESGRVEAQMRDGHTVIVLAHVLRPRLSGGAPYQVICS